MAHTLIVRFAYLGALLTLAGCARASLDPAHYRSTDLAEFRRCFPALPTEIDDDALTVTFLGTTSLLFDDGTDQILIHGFLSRPPVERVIGSMLRSDWGRINDALERVKAYRVRGVFVAHSHYDHALDSAQVARWTGADLYGSPSTLNIGEGANLPSARLKNFTSTAETQVGAFSIRPLTGVHSPVSRYNDNLGEDIEHARRQPVHAYRLVEGGSFDFLIRHRDRTILIRPAAGFDPVKAPLRGVRADILFLALGTLGNQSPARRNAFYEETVGHVRPQLIVPVHWDSPFRSLSRPLRGTPHVLDDVRAGLNAIIYRAERDRIRVRMLDSMQTMSLEPYFGEAGRAQAVGGCSSSD